MTAYTRIRELREPAAFGGWLAAIARNRADPLPRAPEVELPDDLPGRRSDRKRRPSPSSRRSAGCLEAYRETLLMRLVEGMSGQEIAERTGLTPASVLREPAPRHEDAPRETRIARP